MNTYIHVRYNIGTIEGVPIYIYMEDVYRGKVVVKEIYIPLYNRIVGIRVRIGRGEPQYKFIYIYIEAYVLYICKRILYPDEMKYTCESLLPSRQYAANIDSRQSLKKKEREREKKEGTFFHT